MARKRAWGGREPGAEAKAGADGSMGPADGRLGRTGVWGGSEYGADGSTGQKGGWGGREYGAEGHRQTGISRKPGFPRVSPRMPALDYKMKAWPPTSLY